MEVERIAPERIEPLMAPRKGGTTTQDDCECDRISEANERLKVVADTLGRGPVDEENSRGVWVSPFVVKCGE